MQIKHLFIITNINKHLYIGGHKFIATNYHLYFRQIYLVCYHSWHVIGAPIGCRRWRHYSRSLWLAERWRHYSRSLWLAGRDVTAFRARWFADGYGASIRVSAPRVSLATGVTGAGCHSRAQMILNKTYQIILIQGDNTTYVNRGDLNNKTTKFII